MSLESCTQAIRKRIGDDCGLDAKLKVDLGDAGSILVDATVVPNIVSNDNVETPCTLSISLADFESVLAGDLSPMEVFMDGRLKVDGDMGVAMKLQSIL